MPAPTASQGTPHAGLALGATVILTAPAESRGGSSTAWTRLPRLRRRRKGGDVEQAGPNSPA